MLTRKLATAALGIAVAAGAIGAAEAQGGQFIPVLSYRTGPYAPNGAPFANGYVDYFQLINERDGGVNGVKFIVEECETAYKNRPRGGVLRPPEEQARRRYGHQPVVHRHHLRPDRKGDRRQDSDPVDGLRTHERRRRQDIPLRVQLPVHLLESGDRGHPVHRQRNGRHRQAEGPAVRLHLSRPPVRPRADPDLRHPRGEVRLHLRQVPGAAGDHDRAEVDLAPDQAHQPRLRDHVGLGGDELDRRQGGREHPLRHEPLHRQLVVGRRTGRASGRRRRHRLQGRDLQRCRHGLQGLRDDGRRRRPQGRGTRWAPCSTTAAW